jgi:hypothetical protein
MRLKVRQVYRARENSTRMGGEINMGGDLWTDNGNRGAGWNETLKERRLNGSSTRLKVWVQKTKYG